MKCVVCKTNEANQKHHVSYEPELVIDICKSCHKIIHRTHGVGNGTGEKEGKIKEDHPFFTYIGFDKEKNQYLIKDSETNEVLYSLVCKCGSLRFELFGRENQSACYLRCLTCGFDVSISKIDFKKPSEQTIVDCQTTLDAIEQTKEGKHGNKKNSYSK